MHSPIVALFQWKIMKLFPFSLLFYNLIQRFELARKIATRLAPVCVCVCVRFPTAEADSVDGFHQATERRTGTENWY